MSLGMAEPAPECAGLSMSLVLDFARGVKGQMYREHRIKGCAFGIELGSFSFLFLKLYVNLNHVISKNKKDTKGERRMAEGREGRREAGGDS